MHLNTCTLKAASEFNQVCSVGMKMLKELSVKGKERISRRLDLVSRPRY